MIPPYPAKPAARTRWILDQRTERAALNAEVPYAFMVEDEYSAHAEVVPVATVFLTNRECPWRCLMCDLWKNTLPEAVEVGAIPRQIKWALGKLGRTRQIKLYNSGSFFDPHAIPVEDYQAIAAMLGGFERTIVESHPALITRRCLDFRDLLPNELEVAMGLETAHPEILERLNKGMTLEMYAQAAEFLRANDVALRAFILVQPPFMDPAEALNWAQRSLDFAFDCGATAATLIPTRGGNGAMEILAQRGDFSPPCLNTLERAVDYGLALKRGRVFVDLWSIDEMRVRCRSCYPARIAQLRSVNLSQQILPAVYCAECGGQS